MFLFWNVYILTNEFIKKLCWGCFYIIFSMYSLITLYFIYGFYLFSLSIPPWKLLHTPCSNVDWLDYVEVLYRQPQLSWHHESKGPIIFCRSLSRLLTLWIFLSPLLSWALRFCGRIIAWMFSLKLSTSQILVLWTLVRCESLQ